MTLLTWILQNWRLVAGCALLTTAFVFGYTTGGEHVKRQWDLEISIHMKEALAAQAKNQTLVAQLEETKNANLEKVTALEHDIAAMRVRLPSPTRTGSVSQVTTAIGSPPTPAPTCELPTTVQKSLDDFTGTVGAIVRDADEMTEQCRTVMEWSKSLSSSPP